MVIKVKIQIFKLNPMLKSNKAFKLLLVEIKSNSSMLMGFEIARGKGSTKQAKMPYFHLTLTNVLNELANSIHIILFSHSRKIYLFYSLNQGKYIYSIPLIEENIRADTKLGFLYGEIGQVIAETVA